MPLVRIISETAWRNTGLLVGVWHARIAERSVLKYVLPVDLRLVWLNYFILLYIRL